MSSTYRVVKLLKNHLYPTYQLHAFMANEKTTPQDGLRLAALTTMQWLKIRLGDDVPEEWKALPSPEEYLSATDDDLPSLYINQGHVVNIVSLPDKGMWTLQITEPDLGSDPGNPEQTRQAIPGRIIETNIAFLIVDKRFPSQDDALCDASCGQCAANCYLHAAPERAENHAGYH